MTWDFRRELAAWGPRELASRGRQPPVAQGGPPGADAPGSPGLSFSRAYCRRVALSHYENFTVASLLLPRRLRRHFHAVYAYCRWSDDLADETGGGDEALRLLDWWRGELLSCYPPVWSGHSVTGREDRSRSDRTTEPRHPVTVALRETIQRFDIPPEPFLNLLVAFTQDQHVKRYATFDELLGYCRNSANPVGHLVLHLFGAFDPRRAALADEVCTGLQLANFWQDIDRDYAIGRIYLPEEDRKRFGVTEQDIALRRPSPGMRALVRYEVARAHEFFDRGEALLPLLPGEARIDVDLFVRGGRAILQAIRRADYDVLTRRPEVTKFEKAKLLAKAVVSRLVG